MARTTVTDGDRVEAIRRLLAGLAAGQDAFDLAAAVVDLHPDRNTFPGEIYLDLGAEVLADTMAAGAGPIGYEGLRETYLEEVRFRGKENRKIRFAVMCSAAKAGGLEPDLLEEVSWWNDDYWRYALWATVALIRASAHHRDVPVEQIATELAHRHGVLLA